MDNVKLGALDVSRFILGTNPVSGFSHQSGEMNDRMRHYFTMEQGKRLFSDAQALGITAVIARADHFMMRMLMEHWDAGGGLQWIAQTCPEIGSIERGVQNAISGGAKACFIHGGLMDNLLANGRLEEVPPAIELIHKAGMPAGIAGHNPEVHRWAEREMDVDFYMCCYYNPTSRAHNPEHQADAGECFLETDRQVMVDTIATLSRPAIHYKVLAAGRNNPAEALAFTKSHMRPIDAVCIGIYDEKDAAMLCRDVQMIEG